MHFSEQHEVGKNCEALCVVELASDGFEYCEAELKLLVEKWSRYDFQCCLFFDFTSCFRVVCQA